MIAKASSKKPTEGAFFLMRSGDMRLSLQAKLTRVLEERAVRPVGEAQERPIDVRLIAATHRDLEAMVRAGSFREDLWYRLNVALVRLPPLRERRSDIELLAHHFLAQQVERIHDRRIVGFTLRARDALNAFPWPGNVRQLRSAVERACVVSRGGEIDLRDLPPELLGARLGNGELRELDLADCSWAEGARTRPCPGREALSGGTDAPVRRPSCRGRRASRG